MKLLDTGFLIDLQQELTAGREGPARSFLARHSEEQFAISVIAMLEFLEGYERVQDGEDFLEAFVKYEITERVCRTGSRIRRALRKQGRSIGDFDILIAATAIEAEAELVTSDESHFGRIEGLQVTEYR